MTVLAMIEGREAVPIRAIPYITGWSMSPLDLARQLARKDGPPFDFFDDVVAYHMQVRTPERMLPKEWDLVAAALEGLEAQIRAKHQDDNMGYAEWTSKSVPLLPAGIILFKDDFERGWGRQFQSSALKDKREGDSALNYTPLIPSGMQATVMAGFENVLLDDWNDRLRTKAVSKAPPPITPVSGGGGIAPRRYVRRRPQPDWSFWRIRELVKDWEAAALSLGIDPDSMKHNPYAWMAGTGGKASFQKQSFLSAQEEVEFDKRYRLVIDWVRQRGDRVRHHNTGEVLLTGFASWVVEKCLPSNPEFESFAVARGGRPDEPASTPGNAGEAESKGLETPPSVIGMSKAAPFVERKDLVLGFDIGRKWWDNKFKSLSRNTPRWLADAIEDKRPGPRGANLFNPAVVALGLLQEKVQTKNELLTAMRANNKFAPFVEQFKLGLDTDAAD